MKISTPSTLRISLLCTVLLNGVLCSQAATVYNYLPASGSWGTAANWNTGSYPNDTNDSNVTIGSGKTVNVNDGSFSAGYIFVGSSGVLTASGAGHGLTIGNTVGGSGQSMALSGNGGRFTISDGAVVQGAGTLIVGDSSTPGSVTHPRLEITKASATFSTLQFIGGNSNVQDQVVLNEGASLTLSSITTGSAQGGYLIFNGGASGFGSLAIGTFAANKVVNLQINSGSYLGNGSFTLIDATSWSGAFSSILFDGSAYTFGTDVTVGDRTWNINRVGSDLVLNVVPEPATWCLLGSGMFAVLYGVRRRRR